MTYRLPGNQSHYLAVERVCQMLALGVVFLLCSTIAYSAEYLTRKEVETAIARYDQLIEAEQEDAEAYLSRADAYSLLHQFDFAIRDYTAAIKYDDRLDMAYFGRGLAYGRRRLIDEGIADLTVFLDRNPDSSIGYTKRGVRYLWKEDLPNAARDLEKAIALDADNAEAHDDLGVVYSLQDRYGDAIQHFLQTVAIDPSYQKGYHNLALSLYVTDKDEWALNAVNESLKLRPDSRDSMHLKGIILTALGRNEEAEEYLEDAAFLPEANWTESIALPVQDGLADLELTGLDGKAHRFDEYLQQGKWVFLNIWGPKCPPCIEEIPQLQIFHDEHIASDAMVIGMAIDYPGFSYANRAEVIEFVDLNSITYPILLGDANTVPRFGVGPLLATPTTIVFAPGGELVGSHVGVVSIPILEEFLNGQ